MLPIFGPFWNFTNSVEDFILLVLFTVLAGLVISLERGSRSRIGYSPRLAWIRGGVYFSTCFIFSILAGVFPVLVRSPIVQDDQVSSIVWWVFTLVCAGVIYFAYFLLWPRGTLTHGRVLHLPSVLLFGLLWGLSEGQLFLSVWAVIEKFSSIKVLVWLLSFLVIGTFKGGWQTLYWDIHVAPEHNIPAWNGRKVLFGHIPNLICTLAHLALFGNALLFVAFQTAGLISSAYHMRFPPWREIRG